MPEASQHPSGVHLTTADPKRSIRFYEALGFERAESPLDKRSPWASLHLDGQSLTISRLLPAKKRGASGASKDELRLRKKELKAFKKHRHGVGVQIHVRVSDVDLHCKGARRKRVDLFTPLRTHSHGVRDYSVVDPDGYRIVFYSPAPLALAQPAGGLEPKPRRRPSGERTSPVVEELAPSASEVP